jgi:PAS domain S-box-containing protein
MIVDVNELQRAEKAAKEARDYAELLFKMTPSCIFTVDIDRKITSWNDRIAKLTGYSPDEIVGHKCNICPDFVKYGICPLFDNNIKKPIFGKESKIITKSGEEKTIYLNLVTLSDADGNVIGGIESFEDISGRKEMEEALFWEAGINSAFADLSKAIISQASLENISQIILEHGQHLTHSKFGYTGYIDPKTNNFVFQSYTKNLPQQFFSPDDFIVKDYNGLVGWSLKNKKSIITNKPREDSRFAGTHFGQIDIERYIGTPAIFGSELVGQIGFANSSTDYQERDLEVLERLASLYALALQRIRSDDEVLIALKKEQELNELKSNFITMVSHEYRTPLQAILMSTQLLSDYSNKLSEENKQKYFDIISKSVNTMDRLLEDIITLNKMDNGKIDVFLEDIDIENFCSNLTYEMEYLAKNICDIEFKLEKGENSKVKTDEKLIRQSLSAIFSNAVKFTPQSSKILFNVKVTEHTLIFEVTDQGIGISEEDQTHIFEPFYRGKNVGIYPGSGLGLSIAQNSANALGGTVTLRSTEGIGTTFIVEIPIAF